MDKKGGIYIVTAILVIGILMVLQYNRPKDINWYPSYVSTHKIPYGTIVLNDILQHQFGEKVIPVQNTPFEFLGTRKQIDGTYMFINEDVTFGKTELNRLLNWTAKGNSLFIASRNFEKELLDTLHLQLESLYSSFNEKYLLKHRLVHPKLKSEKGYRFNKNEYAGYFRTTDSAQTTIIGTLSSNSSKDSLHKERPDVIKRGFGDGNIILCHFPEAFTNYFILKDANKNYTAGLLSYIDGSRNIYTDMHYKSGKPTYTSPMHILLNTKEFKWAYYLVLIGAVVYILFEGKRKQRAIPVVKPLKNQTLAFTRTIADMYYVKGDAKPIAEQKISNFLEYIRSHYYLGTVQREEEFYIALASRSTHSLEEIEHLFSFLEKLRNQDMISNDELLILNASIDKFKKRAKMARKS